MSDFFGGEHKKEFYLIPDLSGLVKQTDCEAKILEIKEKYFITSDCNKFTSDILDVKIKQKELVNKSIISNLVKNSDLNTRLATLAKKSRIESRAR